jgi:uncharacterized Zn finger protein (UPF0148 family)
MIYRSQSSKSVYILQSKTGHVTNEDDKVKMISALLERGGTMLAQHHECGAPLFKYKGQVLCPVCDDPLTGDIESQAVEVTARAKKKSPAKKARTKPAGKVRDAKLQEILLAYARNETGKLTWGKNPESDAVVLSNIEVALRCVGLLDE